MLVQRDDHHNQFSGDVKNVNSWEKGVPVRKFAGCGWILNLVLVPGFGLQFYQVNC